MMAEVDDIKLHPAEIVNELACCIAYCIGADYENVEKIADTITLEEITDCIELIRNRMNKSVLKKG